MNINLLRHYLANKSPKKQIQESVDYIVVRAETIPYEETHTGIAGTTKTIKNPKGGMTVVLLKFLSGHTTTGVGKTKKEAIQDAVQSKVALFGEAVQHFTEELNVVKNHDGGFLAFNGNPAKNAPVVALVSKSGDIILINKQGAPKVVKTVSTAVLNNPDELKKAIAAVIK